MSDEKQLENLINEILIIGDIELVNQVSNKKFTEINKIFNEFKKVNNLLIDFKKLLNEKKSDKYIAKHFLKKEIIFICKKLKISTKGKELYLINEIKKNIK